MQGEDGLGDTRLAASREWGATTGWHIGRQPGNQAGRRFSFHAGGAAVQWRRTRGREISFSVSLTACKITYSLCPQHRGCFLCTREIKPPSLPYDITELRCTTS